MGRISEPAAEWRAWPVADVQPVLWVERAVRAASALPAEQVWLPVVRAQLFSAWAQPALPAQERAYVPEAQRPWVPHPWVRQLWVPRLWMPGQVRNDSVAWLVTPVAMRQQGARESREQLVCLQGWALPLP